MTKLFGADNGRWKGNKAGYAAKHYRVYGKRGKAKKCIKCGSVKNVHWAKIKGKADYMPLCRSCHAKYDKAVRNLGG